MGEKRLSDLLGLPSIGEGVVIKGITADSRLVKAGDLFVALPGTVVDGREYIDAAIEKGASAILTLKGTKVKNTDIPLIESRNPRRKYAELAAKYYGKQPENMVAVTGTNGKTSVAEFTRQLWARMYVNAASLGTLGVRSTAVERPGGLTTPDPMALHEVLAELAEAGVTHAALEASSHGLSQHRLDGVTLKAAAFTNLTRDHLDYHGTEANYFYTKLKLFGDLLTPDSAAVINIDAPYGRAVEEFCWGRGLKRYTVGHASDAYMQILSITPKQGFQQLAVKVEGKTYDIRIPLIGFFQAENALMAAGLVMATGYQPDDVLPHISTLKGVPGRMEFMGKTVMGGSVYVDYAHTPNGMETALKSARAHKPSKISVLFGCGGNRDAGKRPQMGAIAEELADKIFITDDNPRFEDPQVIRSEILAATPSAVEIPNRKEAIKAAIEQLGKDEILLINGKGHELGQSVAGEVLPHSDLAVVTQILTDMRREAADGK